VNPVRPVYIRRLGHASALGLSAPAAARAQLAGEMPLAARELFGVRYPWFALALAEQAWGARVRRAVGLVGAELCDGMSAAEIAALPFFFGSSSLQAGAIESAARASGSVELAFNAADFGAEVGAMLGIATTPWVFSTGCSSGLAALEAAFILIGGGQIDDALVLGAEFANDTTLAGFAGLGLLAPTLDDDGLILGEAVAGLLLSATPPPQSSWRISACRLGVDGYSATAPTPDGSAIAANLAGALRDGGRGAGEIDLVKPHRGCLPATDEAEEAALARIFGSCRPAEIFFKRQLGHTLGASGPAELTALLALLDSAEGQARYGEVRRLLFNLIGFGGSIAALVLERDPGQHVGVGAGFKPARRGGERRAGLKPAPTVTTATYQQRFDSATLSALARAHCSVPLRRAGGLTELLIAGVAACLGDDVHRPTVVLWGSRVGILNACIRVVSDIALAGEAPLPFDFLATQPVLAAIPLQQSFPCIENVIYQPWTQDADLHWQRLLQLGGAWLASGRCARVLCGAVEPGHNEHTGQWRVLEIA
jgi:3-oxoacyl-[acyl-carrier-protein] synthase-1